MHISDPTTNKSAGRLYAELLKMASFCLSCPISCSTTPGVMCMSSACHQHMLSACGHCLHADVVHMQTSSTHVIRTCTSSTHAHVIPTSSAALLMVSVDLNYLSTLTGTGY